MQPTIHFPKKRNSWTILTKSLISLIFENHIKWTYKIHEKTLKTQLLDLDVSLRAAICFVKASFSRYRMCDRGFKYVTCLVDVILSNLDRNSLFLTYIFKFFVWNKIIKASINLALSLISVQYRMNS